MDLEARYCQSCGSALRRPEPSGPSLQVGPDGLARTDDERRVITVIFADLTGSTALGERLDPEDMRGVLERFFETLAREVLKLDGTVDKYVGDEIMAVFGAPIAHEDDAVRAVRAAVAMQNAMATLNRSLDVQHAAQLALRIGINTGEVVAGILSGQVQGAYTVVGDTVNTAKRLQSAAQPGEIIVGERTRQATARFFQYETGGAVMAKGKAAPLRTYRFVRAADPLASNAAASGVLVGRARERGMVVAAVQRVNGGGGGVVGIVGEPGIGKTRLLAEARGAAHNADLVWLQGQGSSNGQTLSYLPFREMLRAFAGIDQADDDDVKWSKLERCISAVLPATTDEIMPYLGATLALQLPPRAAERVAGLDGDAMRRQILRTMYLLFEGIAKTGPTVVAFEDCQWMDRSSEQLLAHLLPLSDRLLFIWTGRPERDTPVERTIRSCEEIAGAHYAQISLAPLTPDDSAALCCDLLGITTLPPALRDAVVRRAEGNPFFAQEILRALRDTDVLRHDDTRDEWVLSEAHDAAALPTTIQGIIAARIDRLSEDSREVARVAAVIGRTFSYRLLVTVSGSRDVAAGLAELERQAIVRERRGGEPTYGFSHTLVQETVYAGLLVRRRRELHARVAAAMELVLDKQIEEYYGVLAYHYAHAENWTKAQEYLFRVGDQALRIAADAEAIDHYERALEAYARAFGDRWDPFERAAVERKIGESRYRLGEYERATRHLDRALELLRFGRPRTRAGVRIAIAHELLRQIVHRVVPIAWLYRKPPPASVSDAVLQTLWFHQFIDFSSDLERLLYDILRALNIAERAGASNRTLRSYFGVSVMCHNIGLAGMGRRYADMADAMAPRVGGALADAIAHAGLGLDGYAVGDWDRAMQELSASADGYLASGDLEAWAPINAYRTIVLVARGRLAEALQIADAVEQTGRAARDRRMETLGAHIRGHVLSWAGRERDAVVEYERAIASYRLVPDHHLWLSATGTLAKAYLRLDEPEAARARIDEGVRLAREHRLRGWHMTPLLTARSELLLRDAAVRQHDRASLLAAADAACGRLRGQGRLHYEAVPAMHRQRGSLEWLRGRPERAAAAWRRSLDAADRLGAITDRLETHEAIARYTASAADRDQAASILARLRAGVPAAAA